MSLIIWSITASQLEFKAIHVLSGLESVLDDMAEEPVKITVSDQTVGNPSCIG